MELREYLGTIATQLVNELTPILQVKAVTSNTDLLGKYTEAAVGRLVQRVVEPLRVCTGAVIDHPMPDRLRQIDLILWAPFPAPAIFEVGGFGLVPRSSAFGVIEIKRSNYSGVDDRLDEFLADVEARRIVGDPQGPMSDYQRSPGIGLVSVLDTKPSMRLSSLINDQKVVAIFEKDGDLARVRHGDVLSLINFLHYVTWRYRVQGALPGYPQIALEPIG